MALTDECTNTTMLVQPAGMYNCGGGNNNSSGFGDAGNGWWVIILFILIICGWGNGYGNNGGANAGAGGAIPYILNADSGASVQRGFDQAAITGGLGNIQAAVTAGFGNTATQLCNCCADIQSSLCNGFAGVEANASARQMADMQQAFALQTATSQGFNGVQSQLASCCCDLKSGIEGLKYTIATEECATRTATNEGLRDVIASQNAGFQRVLDQLCADKIDAKNEKIADLQRQLTMANLSASQVAQTATLSNDFQTRISNLGEYLNPTPRPAYIVQNPNCCVNPCGCNSGCGGF